MATPVWLAPTPAGIPRLSDATTVSSFPSAQREQASAIDRIIGGIENRAPVPVPVGADLNTYTTPGEYHVTTNTVAAGVANLPTAGPGILEVRRTSNGIVSQVYYTYGAAVNLWYRATASVNNGTFTAWETSSGLGGKRLTNTDLDTLKTPGMYYTGTTTDAASIINSPTTRPAFYEVRTTPNGMWLQIVRPYGTGVGYYARTTASVTNGTWAKWDHFAPDAGQPETGSDADPYRRPLLIEAFKRRRGGSIGTAGLPVVALRFDHGMDKFKSLVLPLLRKYDLPWLQAMNSRMHTTASNVSQNLTMSFAEVEAAALNTGGEVANHSATHKDAATADALQDEIVTGLAELRAALPALVVESWCPPGVAEGGYGGAAPFRTLEQHYGTKAGRMILSHHAGVFGYLGGAYRDMPADMDTAGSHITLDAVTSAATVRSILNTLQAGQPTAAVLMVHPSLLDTGALSTAVLEEIFQDIAARRDAGTLAVLTPTGALLADHRTPHRHDLILNGGFTDGLNGWTNSDGYEVTTEDGLKFARTANGVPLVQSIPLYRKDHLTGGARELVATVRAISPAVAKIRVAGPNGLDTGKDVNITPAQGWREIRQPLVIPAGATTPLTVTAGRLSGGALDIRNIRLQSI